MLLFLPQIILGATFLILLASNLFQRGFRSSWVLTVSGAGLALVGLLFLRLRLPSSLSFSAWWAGEGLVSSISFVLDGTSWQIAFIVVGSVLAFFLSEVQRAMSAPWLNWAINLALAVASLLAVFSADLLTLTFFWILVDVISGLAIPGFVNKAEERSEALSFLPMNIAASFILLAAWFLIGYSSQLSNVLAIASAALRLGIFSPTRRTASDSNQLDYLRLLPAASVLILLARPLALEGVPLIIALLVMLPPALFIAYRLNQREEPGVVATLFEQGFSVMAIVAAIIGQPAVALAFGLVLLVSRSLLLLAQSVRRWRWPIIAASALLFSVLPFITVSPDANTVPLSFFFLVTEAALISGWVNYALRDVPETSVSEPWMRVIDTLGLLLIPLLYLLLAFGLAPDPSVTMEAIWWPAIAVLILAVGLFFVSRRIGNRFAVPQRLAGQIELVISMRWLEIAFDWMKASLGWVLRKTSRVLEGQAGVLWALLLIVLLLSLASQFALSE